MNLDIILFRNLFPNIALVDKVVSIIEMYKPDIFLTPRKKPNVFSLYSFGFKNL